MLVFIGAYVVLYITVCIVSHSVEKKAKRRAGSPAGGYFGPKPVVRTSFSSGRASGGIASSFRGTTGDSDTPFCAGTTFDMGIGSGSSSSSSGFTSDQDTAAFQAGFWGADDFEQTTGMRIDDIM